MLDTEIISAKMKNALCDTEVIVDIAGVMQNHEEDLETKLDIRGQKEQAII